MLRWFWTNMGRSFIDFNALQSASHRIPSMQNRKRHSTAVIRTCKCFKPQIWRKGRQPHDGNQVQHISGIFSLHISRNVQADIYIYIADRHLENILACVSVPSAVSSMLERLCPRLMPLTAGGRSTLDPRSWGVEDVTSGGTLFSGGEEKVSVINENNRKPSLFYIGAYSWSEDYLCVCGPVRRPTRKQRVGAVAGSWALHGRGWKKQTRTWRSFGRNGWSSNQGSAGSGLALHWELPFCAVSPHPLMQRMCLMERESPNYLLVLFFYNI